jgi:outer membrane protein TolC
LEPRADAAKDREALPGEIEPLPPPENIPTANVVTLDHVAESAVRAYPGLEAALREMEIAQGRETAAWGEFDLKLKADGISNALGFYRNHRQSLKLEQATMPGGTVYGQYRNGDGDFPVWYGERETDEGGEFKVGLLASLLRDRAIDPRRAAIFVAQWRQREVEPAVRGLVLEIVFAGADAYWSWVAAKRSMDVQQELLRVTRDRNETYELRVQKMDLPRIELVQNQRLIVARRAKLIETERKVQQSAIKLSLYLRDGVGRPFVPPPQQAPAFPEPQPHTESENQEIGVALANRPELEEIGYQMRQVQVENQLAQNQTLPSLTAGVEAGKDVGASASSKRDKTPLELEAGLYFELPYQRRKAYGKMRETEAKLAQLSAKRRLVENKIVLQVQDAISGMRTAYDRVQQARENVRLARELESAERLRFDRGDSDLLRVAIQEGTALEAALTEIDALSDFFKSEAAFRAAIGRQE